MGSGVQGEELFKANSLDHISYGELWEGQVLSNANATWHKLSNAPLKLKPWGSTQPYLFLL